MKRGKVLMTVLVVLAVLFASCSNGMSKDDASGAASGEKVMVSLGVDVEGAVSQKAISSDTDLSGLTYWYRANHNWEQDRPVHGDTGANYIMIPNYSAGAAPKNIGYFTAGEWSFWAQVKKGDTVIYSSVETPYIIRTNQTSPTIIVKPATGGNGNISFSVNVPSTSGVAPTAPEAITVLINNSGEGIVLDAPTYADGLATFSGHRNDLAPGPYTVTFKYTDKGGAVTEGAAQAVTVFAGQTSNITGTIDAGKWHPTSITIKAPGIDPFTLTPESAHRTPLGPAVVFTAAATSTQGNAITYKWYVNGNGPQNIGNATLSYELNVPGMFDITCTATDATAGVTASKTVYIQVGYNVALGTITGGTVDYGVNSSATAIFAPGDIVSLSATPTTPSHRPVFTITGITELAHGTDIEYDAAANVATFRMPAATATVNVAFSAPYTVAIGNNISNGTVKVASKGTSFAAGETVLLAVTPAAGYHLATLKAGETSIYTQYSAVTGIAYFVMPAAATTITATFEADAP